MNDDNQWLILISRMPAEPSRHRVAVWRELRKAGAVPISSGAWALPQDPKFDPAIARVAHLCEKGGGALAVLATQPRDVTSGVMLPELFEAARRDEWKEFIADCGKFQGEIDREIAKQKFTFGELEEEEQSLGRLQRWILELDKRQFADIATSEASAARDALERSIASLNHYAGLVYDAMRVSSDSMAESAEAAEA
ncbi:Chromate resistance protein ChrB [Subtercola vilae]|uniref:Chromate resistance protein ChrB n=1 Tax=Subtercola vilae TaxID=2056433 RepID=A0A4T2BXD9_9MICO|nr:Chromate resistance protein ChrB [Subtercola vilae]TIH36170.1 chromate resistance protein ChrB [Subtercola vilae]